MKRVLVLDATQRSALAVTRSLGKRGIPVYTADHTPTTLAGSSRYSIQNLIYPDPRLHSDLFVKSVAAHVREHDLDILLPLTELTASHLLVNKQSLAGVALPFPDIGNVHTLSDKYKLMQLAESLDIPVPRTWYVENVKRLPLSLDEAPYPVVLKPGRSWIQLDNGQWIGTSVKYANNPTEARDLLANNRAFSAHPFLIQECVTGHGEGVFCLYDTGVPVAHFAHRRLREKPPSGGVSVLSESMVPNPALLSYARSLLDKSSWHGIAMVEFKVSADGTPYLMEVNTRFWGSLQLAIDAGVDFPYMLYQITNGIRPEPVDKYKIGIRLRWLLGDLDSLYLTIRNKDYSLNEKVKAVGRFLTPSPLKTRHEIIRWHDLNPAWYEIKQYIKDIFR